MRTPLSDHHSFVVVPTLSDTGRQDKKVRLDTRAPRREATMVNAAADAKKK
jgi:hypothetical protein